jgi:hypothetical protein
MPSTQGHPEYASSKHDRPSRQPTIGDTLKDRCIHKLAAAVVMATSTQHANQHHRPSPGYKHPSFSQPCLLTYPACGLLGTLNWQGIRHLGHPTSCVLTRWPQHAAVLPSSALPAAVKTRQGGGCLEEPAGSSSTGPCEYVTATW